MRDYVRTEAHRRSQAFVFPKLARLVRNWFTRRHFRQLDQFDDFILRDIGLTREDLNAVRGLPLEIDPVQELVRRRANAARTDKPTQGR